MPDTPEISPEISPEVIAILQQMVNPPAHPQTLTLGGADNFGQPVYKVPEQPGISILDFYAAASLTGNLAWSHPEYHPTAKTHSEDNLAHEAFLQAEAMVKERVDSIERLAHWLNDKITVKPEVPHAGLILPN